MKFEVKKIVDLAVRAGVRPAHETVPDDANVELFHRFLATKRHKKHKINLLQMSVPMVAVDSKSRFANHVAKLHDVFHKIASFLLVPSVPFRGYFIRFVISSVCSF